MASSQQSNFFALIITEIAETIISRFLSVEFQLRINAIVSNIILMNTLHRIPETP